MSIEAGPYVAIHDAWGGIHSKRLSTMTGKWDTSQYHVLTFNDGGHITIEHKEWARIKAVLNHRPRPK